MKDFVISAMKNYPVFVLLAANSILMLLTAIIRKFIKNWQNFQKEAGKELPGRWLYIVLILPPFLWLLTPLMLAEAKGPLSDPWRTLYEVLVYRIEEWFILPVGLFFVIFMVYVFVGIKDDQAHRDIFKPRKLVWFVFGIGLLFVIWFVPNTLLKAKAKFVGMHIDVMFDTGEAIKDINIAAAGLTGADREIKKQDLLDQLHALESSLISLKNSIQVELDQFREAANRMAAAVAEATVDEPSVKSATEIARKLEDTKATVIELQNAVRRLSLAAFNAGAKEVLKKAEDLQQQVNEKVLPQMKTVGQKLKDLSATKQGAETVILKATSDAREEIKKLQKTVGSATEPEEGSVVHMAVTLSRITGEAGLKSGFCMQTRNIIRKTIGQMLVLVDDLKNEATKVDFTNDSLKQSWRINEIQDKAQALQLAADGLRPDMGIPMLMVGVLFFVFLLMPWLLYISFILRKREQIVNDRLDLLGDLNLLERFRTAAKLSRDLAVEGASIARQKVSLLETINIEDIPDDRKKLLKEASLAFKKVIEMEGQTPTAPQGKEIAYLADTETLNRQTFHSREYLIPLMILSVLSLVGWYYIIFAKGTNGLVNFIEQGGGSSQMTELLAQFTPFTAVFAGAWLFMTIMLTYRWVKNDLNPGAYFYASIRLVWGLVAGMVFMMLFGTDAGFRSLTVAFFVGMFPLEFVTALWEFLKDRINKGHAKQIIKYFNLPRWASHQPLTSLEDINMWDDIRFLQEGIFNVHSLATADLVRLAMRMPYAAQTLVDWVDQAILRIHTKVLWHAGMNAISIRNATDLLDVCGVDSDEEGAYNDEMLTRVTVEFNGVQLMGIGTGDARFEVYREAGALKTAGEALVKATRAGKDNRKELDPAKPETLDRIVSLRGTVSGLKIFADKAAQSRQKAYGKLVSLDAEDIALSWADGGELDKALKTLSEGANGLIAGAENLLTEDKLTSKMLEDDLAKTDDDVKPGQAALQKAQEAVRAMVVPAEKAKKAAEKSVPQLNEIKKAVQPLKEKVDTLRGKIETVISKSASAKTKGDGLTPANIGDLEEELDQLLAAASEAESAVGELAAAGDKCSGVLKEKAMALKEALGEGSNQLQARIKTAKEECAKGAADTGALAAAKNAVKEIADAVGTADSMDDETIAGRIKAIAEPLQDVGVDMDKAVAAVVELSAAISRADLLAQSIKIGDATTWDNIKKLSGLMSKLKTAVQNTETASSAVKTKLEGLKKQQTMALLEAQKKLNELFLDDAGKKAEAAEKAFKDEKKNTALSVGSSEAKLKEAIQNADSALLSAETLAVGAAAAAEEIMRAVLPSRLTKGVLQIMLDTIKKDPNIGHIRRFWKVQMD